MSAAALAWSLKDAKDYIDDVIDQYKILRSVTSEGFWSTAEAGVRAFSNAVMPLAQEHMPRLAAELGKIPGAVSAAFATPEGQNSLARFFENTRAALANMVDGFTALSSALLRLVERGVKVKATGFGRVHLDPAAVVRAIVDVDPTALMAGTDLPSTRAERPFRDEDLRVVAEAVPAEHVEDVFWANAARFYLGSGTGGHRAE